MKSHNAAALVVGIGQYAHAAVRNLKCAQRDAEETYRVLIHPDHCAFPTSQVRLLTDASATREKLANSLTTWLPSVSKGTDLAVVYFAGHGLEVPEGAGSRAYLVPHDGNPVEAPTWCIPLDEVRRWLGGISARAVVAIFDCCHSGWLVESRGTARGPDPGRSMFDDQLKGLGGEGRCVLASCKSGQQSWEYEQLGHGLFTYYLLKGLRGEAKDTKGRVGVMDLFEYVSAQVDTESQRSYSQKQEPWFSALISGNVFLSGTSHESEEHDHLLAKLAEIGEQRNLQRLHVVLRCLDDPVEAVRIAARACWEKLGWLRISKEIIRWGSPTQPMPARVETALDLFAKARVAGALDVLRTLAERLKGDLRLRAARILDKHEFDAEQDRVKAHFNNNETAYNIDSPLGRDPQTAVFAAHHDVTKNRVAIRILRPELTNDHEKVYSFLEQCGDSYRYAHPNLLTIKDVVANSQAKLYYFVRENADGRSLRAILRGGSLDARARLSILRQVTRALTAVHRCGFGHGAVKPSNIYVDEKLFVKLGDRRLVLPGWQPPRDDLVYDARYTAPEAFGVGKRPTPAADYYSLGCVAFELHWNQTPFHSDDDAALTAWHMGRTVEWPQLQGMLPPSAKGMLERLLEKDPAGRLVDPDRIDDWIDTAWSELSAGTVQVAMGTACPAQSDTAGWATSTRFEAKRVKKPDPARDATIAMPGPGVRRSKDAAPVSPQHAPDPEREPDDWFASLPSINGRPFLDPCTIHGQVGKGGMGIVFRAWHTALKIPVAVKCLKPDGASSAEATERFLDEARLAARLSDDNLVRVYDVRSNGDLHYIVLEYVEGASVDELIRRRKSLDLGEVVAILSAVGRGLAKAHANSIVHRDIKPANILAGIDGSVKLSDLGLGGFTNVKLDERPKMIAGTPAYMPPEQWLDLGSVGPSGDVFSLGATGYHLLSGNPPPVRDDEPKAAWTQHAWDSIQAPPSLIGVLRRAAAIEPADRYPDAAAFVAALEALDLPSLPVRVPRVQVRSDGRETIGQIPMSADSDLLTMLIEKGLATDRHDKLEGDCQQLFACRSGMCGLCIARVSSGAEHLSEMGRREARSLRLQLEFLNAEQGRGLSEAECRLTCQARFVGAGDVVMHLLGNTDAAE